MALHVRRDLHSLLGLAKMPSSEGPVSQIRKQSEERNRDDLYEVQHLQLVGFFVYNARFKGDRAHEGPKMNILSDG